MENDSRDRRCYELRKGFLKKEAEGMIFTAQEQVLRRNLVKKNIDKKDVSEKCRMCGVHDESIFHLVLFVGQSKDSKQDPRHLRLKEFKLDALG